MELGALSPSPRLSFSTTHGPIARLRRAFSGVTWRHVGMLLALCVVWAASSSTHDVLWAWQNGVVLGWLFHQVGGNSACMAIIAVLMATALVVVGNLGPQSGWRRAVALAVTIAAIAPLAGVVRLAWLVHVAGMPYVAADAGNPAGG